jgi:aminoglycoside phosphotransferase (APT) family kinase protein
VADSDDLDLRLAMFLEGALGRDGLEVVDLWRLSGGASRETWSFDLLDALTGVVEPLILQRVRPGVVGGNAAMEGEADLLAAAAAAGVPVAPVVAAADDPSVLGTPFLVMGRVEGETIARRILRDDSFAAARAALVGQCGRALASIHQVPVSSGPHLRADEPVTQLRGLMDALGQPHPAFELALRWLDDHRPPEVTPSVVHGDFRLGNLIVGEDGLRAVLDWELAHLGDPIEDLGWLCVRAWRFGSQLPVAGLGDYDELRAAYEAASGRPVDPEALRWWEVLGTLRWGVICILQASSHLSGASRSVELAAIGRRVCENEYDLLRLIGAHEAFQADPRPPDEAPDTDRAELHDAPSAAQLVDAVREFLEGDVMGATTGRVQFHARVAANVLAMVERELRAGVGPPGDHRRRLAALGFADDAGLAEAIRSGAVTAAAAASSVWLDVLAKVQVANPGYLLPQDRPDPDREVA